LNSVQLIRDLIGVGATGPNLLFELNVYVMMFAADFGFARFLQDGVMAATLCGSPMYMVVIDSLLLYNIHSLY